MQIRKVVINKSFFQCSIPARYAVLGVLDGMDVTGFIATRTDADKEDLLFDTKLYLKSISHFPSSVTDALKSAVRNTLWGVPYYQCKGAVWADENFVSVLKHTLKVNYQTSLLKRNQTFRMQEDIRPTMNLRMGSQLTPFPQPSMRAIAAIRAAAQEAEKEGRNDYAQSLYRAAQTI